MSVNTWSGFTSTVIKLSDNSVRKVYKKGYQWAGVREAECLKRLHNFNHFPKFIAITKDHIDMSYCGERLSISGKEQQCNEILNALKECKITHRDINPRNLLTLNNIVYLVDFSWAILDNEVDTPVRAPSALGGKYYKNNKWNDKIAMEISLKDGIYRK